MRNSFYKGVSNGKSMENQFYQESQLKLRPKNKHFSLLFWAKSFVWYLKALGLLF